MDKDAKFLPVLLLLSGNMRDTSSNREEDEIRIDCEAEIRKVLSLPASKALKQVDQTRRLKRRTLRILKKGSSQPSGLRCRLGAGNRAISSGQGPKRSSVSSCIGDVGDHTHITASQAASQIVIDLTQNDTSSDELHDIAIKPRCAHTSGATNGEVKVLSTRGFNHPHSLPRETTQRHEREVAGIIIRDKDVGDGKSRRPGTLVQTFSFPNSGMAITPRTTE